MLRARSMAIEKSRATISQPEVILSLGSFCVSVDMKKQDPDPLAKAHSLMR
jgi:hypothetical protein